MILHGKIMKKILVGALVIGIFIGTGITLEKFPLGAQIESVENSMDDRPTLNVCVDWEGSFRGGQCNSWYHDQKISYCPNLVNDYNWREFCLMENYTVP